MSKEQKLVPELRFPEFKSTEPWDKKTIEETCDVLNNMRKPLAESEREKGSYPYYGASGIIDYVKDYIFTERLLLVGEDGAKWGPYERTAFIVEGKFWVNNHAHVLKPMLVNDKFLEDYLVKLDISQYVTGAAPPKLTLGKLKSIPVPIPKSSKEQQKIADCLSSLDELITAENQKLEALQLHKKGLMQQLFPTEGEKVPKLRFKEFRDSGEWEEKSLGSCLLREPEYGINAPAVPYSKELPTYLRITDISETGHFLSNEKVSVEKEVTENNYLEEGDIVLARTGASVGKSYKYKSEDGRLVFAGFLIRVKPDKEKLYSELLFQLLSTDRYWRWVKFTSARSGQPGINGTEYSSMMLSLPPTLQEQQKVSHCLSSLDNLMYRQNQKIENLKAHKKGLMQQLFPDVNEISA